MNNDKIYKNYQRKKIYRYLIIIFSLMVIVLESFAIFNTISYLWGIIPFALSAIVKYLYQKEDNNKNVKKDKK